jgi:hypothetical protein
VVAVTFDQRSNSGGKFRGIADGCQRGEISSQISFLIPANHPTANFVGQDDFFAPFHCINQRIQNVETGYRLQMLALSAHSGAGFEKIAQFLLFLIGQRAINGPEFVILVFTHLSIPLHSWD